MNIYQAQFCTYLTVIIHEDLPFMYIGSGKTEDVLSGKYKGSITSKQYTEIFNKLKQEEPHLVQSEVINQFETREEAYAEEIKLHAMYDVARCPVFMNKARATSTRFTCDGFSEEVKAKMSNSAKKRFENKVEREKISATLTGTKLSEEHKKNISAGNKGRICYEETKAKISTTLKGHIVSQTTRDKLSAANKGQIPHNKGKNGKPHSQEAKDKISATLKSKPQLIVTCPHCGKSGRQSNMTRFHFDNCKLMK